MSLDYIPCFEIKEISDEGTFSGIASVYGVEDLGGDVIDKGAFKKTLAENPTVPILWQHDAHQVIGQGTVKEWQGKIMLEAQLDMEDPTAQKAFGKMKKKLIKGLSIGFTTIKSTWEELENRSIRHIGELKLWEVSVVTFPMLTSAQVTRVKNADPDQLAALVAAEVAKQVSALPAAQPTVIAAGEGKEAATSEPEPVDHSEALAAATKAIKEATWN